MPRLASFMPFRSPAPWSTLFVGAALLAGASPAFADSIDGKWCSEDGRRIIIEGSTGIWGAGGLKLTGEYLRYTYAFPMPAGEPEAGQRVEMRFRRSDQRILVTIGGGEAKVWQRCLPEISRARGAQFS